MADIVNLKRFKKKAGRDQAAKQAETNRALHGRTKAERTRDDRNATQHNTQLDQHRIGGDET